jgi:oxygen-dependent protoporphyrinogen oxidase
VPEGGKSLRAFFGGKEAEALQNESNAVIIAAATREMEGVLGSLPKPTLAFARRLSSSLPQYGVGHGERMAELQGRVDAVGALHLLGNGYRGVGLPDLIRDGRAAARELV